MTDEASGPQDVLRDEILGDAKRQAERATRRAGRDAKSIVKQAETEGKQERDEKRRAAEAIASRHRERALAGAPVEIGRMRAGRVEQELDGIRDEAARRVREREGFDPRETAIVLAADAIAHMEGDAFVVALAEADHRALGNDWIDAVRERVGRDGLDIRVADTPAGIAAGVVVRDPEGRQVWDNSLEARLKRMWPTLRSAVADWASLVPETEASGEKS